MTVDDFKIMDRVAVEIRVFARDGSWRQSNFEVDAPLRVVVDRPQSRLVETVVRLPGVGECRAVKNTKVHEVFARQKPIAAVAAAVLPGPIRPDRTSSSRRLHR